MKPHPRKPARDVAEAIESAPNPTAGTNSPRSTDSPRSTEWPAASRLVAAHEEIRRLAELQRAIAENAASMVLTTELDGRIASFNPAAERLTGYTSGEVIGKLTPAAFCDPKELAERAALMSEELGTSIEPGFETLVARTRRGLPNAYEWSFGRKDGSRFPCRLAVTALRDADGEIVGFLGIAFDMTERKEAEAELRSARERLADIVEFLPDATFVIDAEKRVIAWNRALEEMTGVRKEEMLGQGDYAYAIPWWGERMPLLIDLVGNPSADWTSRYDYLERDGDTVIVEVFVPRLHSGQGAYLWIAASPLLDDAGNQVGAIESIRDITDRKRAERALRESEEKYRLLVENANDLVFSVDRDGRFTYVSPNFERVTGCPAEQLLGRPFAEGLHPDDVERVETSFRGTLDEGADVVEYRVLDRDGSLTHLRASTRRIMHGNDVVGVTGIATDVTERKRAEDALRESEELYRSLVDLSPEAIFLHADGKLTYANVSALELFRATDPTDLLGKSPISFVHPDYRAVAAERIRQSYENHEKAEWLEEKLIRVDGEVFEALVASMPVTIAGQPASLLEVRDISQQKRAEEALRESEERYRSLVELSPEAIFVHAGGRVVYVNQAGVALFRASCIEDLLGRPVMSFIHADSAPIVEERVRRSYETREPGQWIEERMYRLDGEPFDVLVASAPVSYGGEAGTLVVVRDVTERKRAEEALRESEERYRRITETITDYVFQVKVEAGRAVGTTHGPGCVAVTGYTPEDLVADPNLWLAMVVPEDRAAVEAQAREVLSGERFDAIEHRIVRKDGAVRLVRNTPVPQFGLDGSLIAYDGLIQDITERRSLEEQLLQAQKMESIGRLAGGVAHDFNNLLTAVLGNAALAEARLATELPADHQLRIDIQEIIKAGEGAASLTRQLLSFASKQRIAPVRLDLSEAITQSLTMLGRLLGEDIEIVTSLEPKLGTVEADRGQIQQLLVNLALNARDAMPRGGKLVIATANVTVDEAYAARHPQLSPWHYAQLSVTDTGAGMTEEVRAHLFEPFFTTKERGKGTGLGLATCHGIVKQIGGQIRVYSEPGHGTTFRILLPRVDGIPESPAEWAAEPVPGGSETLLVVEDEPAVRRLAALGLRAHGYEVLEAGSAAEALELVAHLTSRLDAVVSDVVMPGMSGPELANRLLALLPRTRVLLMSGHAEAAILPPDFASRGYAFLPKPFTPERLARRVRELLDSPATAVAAAQRMDN